MGEHALSDKEITELAVAFLKTLRNATTNPVETAAVLQIISTLMQLEEAQKNWHSS